MKKRLSGILLSLALMMTMIPALSQMAYAADTVTVTWNWTDFPAKATSFAKDGVTMRAKAITKGSGFSGKILGPCSFSAGDDYTFTRIVIAGMFPTSAIGFGDGWRGSSKEVTWIGNSKEVEFIESSLMDVQSIQFTLQPVVIDYDLWVGGTRVTSEHASDTGWSYNYEDNTLTLSGANITKGQSDYGIEYTGSEPLNIVLESGTKTTIDGKTSGISCSQAELIISGKGTLIANNTIHANKSITINGGNVNASMTSARTKAISSKSVTINGGNVVASATGDYGIGIDIDSPGSGAAINGGTLTAVGGGQGIDAQSVTIGEGMGINAGDDESDAQYYDAGTWGHTSRWVQIGTAYPLFVGRKLVTSANASNITGSETPTASYDAESKTLTLDGFDNDGRIHTWDSGEKHYSAVICAEDDLTIELKGRNIAYNPYGSDHYIYGIYSERDLTIRGSGGLDARSDQYGIYVNDGDMEIDGGTVTGIGKYKEGIYVVRKLFINGGDITAVGGTFEGKLKSGIYAGRKLALSDRATVMAGDDEENASDVTSTFVNKHDQKWVHINVAEEPAPADTTPVGSIHNAGGSSYVVTSAGTVSLVRAKSRKSYTLPAAVNIEGKTFNVTGIAYNAFRGTKVRTLTVRTKGLTKASVRGSLRGSKVRTVKVKVGSKKENRSFVKKYKKMFTKKNAGKKVRVKR